MQDPGDGFAVTWATKNGGGERAEDHPKGWRQLLRTREAGEIKNNNAKREKRPRKGKVPVTPHLCGQGGGGTRFQSHVLQLSSMQCGFEAEGQSRFLGGYVLHHLFWGSRNNAPDEPFAFPVCALGFGLLLTTTKQKKPGRRPWMPLGTTGLGDRESSSR